MKECNSCGKCCIKYRNGQLAASEQEIEYWEVFRPEIAENVSNKQIWANPKHVVPMAECLRTGVQEATRISVAQDTIASDGGREAISLST